MDVNVQEEFDEYLAERGVDQNLAVFLPEYAEYKEQKVRAVFFGVVSVERVSRLTVVLIQEYVDWLQNVKKFVEA